MYFFSLFSFLVAVIPGGAEEALLGHENAYAVQWESSTGRPRCGFAKAALSVGSPIPVRWRCVEDIPIFIL